MSRVIAIANSKGGTGKTTTAVNLAGELARSLMKDGEIKGRVLIIDLDPQGHVAHALGIAQHLYDPDTNPNGSCVSFLIQGQQSLAAKADRSRLLVWAHRPQEGLMRQNLFAILSTRRLNSVMPMMLTSDYFARQDPTLRAGHVFVEQALSVRMSDFTSAFAYVIIDCPPNLGHYAPMVYQYADEVIIPVRTDALSVDGMVQHVEQLIEYRNKQGVRAGYSLIVPTMVKPRQKMDQFALQRMKDIFGDKVAEPILDLVSVKEAPGVGGRTLREYAPDSPASQAYHSLAKRVIQGG